jgi:hypothetical protein
MRLIFDRICLPLILHKAPSLQFREMPGKGSCRDMGCRLHFNERIRAIFDGAIHLDPAWMREGRRHFEEHIGGLRFSTDNHPKCGEDLPGSAFSRARRWPVFHAQAHPPATQQRACFQRAQVLAGGWERQPHLPGHAGDRLVRLPNQQSEYLQALAVSQHTAGAPKRWLTRGRLRRTHRNTLCKVCQLVNAMLELEGAFLKNRRRRQSSIVVKRGRAAGRCMRLVRRTCSVAQTESQASLG